MAEKNFPNLSFAQVDLNILNVFFEQKNLTYEVIRRELNQRPILSFKNYKRIHNQLESLEQMKRQDWESVNYLKIFTLTKELRNFLGLLNHYSITIDFDIKVLLIEIYSVFALKCYNSLPLEETIHG